MSEAKVRQEAEAAERPHGRLDDLYRRYSAWLTARVRGLFGADAEDIVQETWLRLAPIGPGVDIAHPKAFLITVARNIGVSRGRQARRRADMAAQLEDPTSNPETDAGGQIEAILISQIVLGLPQPLQDVFLLSRFGGLTNTQIAEHLGISPKTVEKRMTKALAHCAAQLRL